MSQHWRRLPLSDESAPPLLFKYNTTAKGYEFYLTDLTYIWSERLNHRDVLQRAEDEETSIDPSEDAEQFSVLLQKIQDAFLGSKDSRVVLKPGLKSNSLEVTTITRLPAPLKPLRWTLYLSREPPAEFTRQLFLPLLKEQVDRDRRERSLLDQLREKDWVLGKIFDKIEFSGLDLSTVFPGTAGLRGAKRGTSLTHAAKFIKGVAPFDEKAWRSSFDSANVGLRIATDLVDQVSDPSSALDKLDAAPDRWWESLEIEEPVSKPSRTKKTETRYEEPSTAAPLSREDTASLASSDEDEFQRQETPPRLKRAKQKPQQVEHPTTESDEEAEPVPRKRSTSPARPQQKQKPKGLGVIGGPKIAPAAPAAPRTARSLSSTESERSPEPPPTTSGIPPAADEETESDEALPPPRPKQVADSTTKSAKPTGPTQKRVLGTIGGRKAKPEEKDEEKQPSLPDSAVRRSRSRSRSRSQSTDDESHLTTSTQTKPPVKRTGKLGVIGGTKKTKSLPTRTPSAAASGPAAEATASTDNDLDSDTATRPKATKKQEPSLSRSPSSSPAPAPPPEPKPEPEPERELTAQEKADKKREELKRQLEEAKSKAAVKKKRRF